MKTLIAVCLVALSLLFGGTTINAADLSYKDSPASSTCFLMTRSPILDLSTADQMESEVTQRYQHALDVSVSDDTIANSSPRFPWAVEAKAACGKAIGYFRGREVNDEMISKCDCYYGRMSQYIYD